MNWQALLNPWGEVRRLRERNAYLEGCCDELHERAREESEAFARASEHYCQRSRLLEAHSEAMVKKLADIAALTPSPIARVFWDGETLQARPIDPQDFYAAPGGG